MPPGHVCLALDIGEQISLIFIRVPALELKVTPHQAADLRLEPLVARLEPPDLLGEVIGLALLHVGVWRPVERLPPE
jgi:hypothetical protein